jgi:hypothetical protein
MFRLRSVVLLLVLCAVALPQTKVLMYDFEARGVDVSVTKTAGQVLRDALNGTYKYIVVDPAAGTFCYNVVAAADSAKKYNATEALIGNIMTIGGKQWLTYQLVDAVTAAVLLADKFQLPPMEEFPVMSDRIAASIVEKKPYAATVEPEMMTSPEENPQFKYPRKPYAGMFLTAGYDFLVTPRPHDEPYPDYFSTNLVNLNLAVSFETQQMLTMLQMGLLRGNHDEQDISFDLLGNYVAGKGDWAPFFGGGIGITRFSWTDTIPNVGWKNNKNDGLSLNAGVGVIGLRTYYFRIIAAAYMNYTVASNEWDSNPATNSKSMPGLKVMFGVSTPSLGPDATVKTSPACVGAAIGGFFLTGLIIALVS